jgi:hypothetical protein
MKYVIVLLLSVGGVEEIKLNITGSSCETLAETWRGVHTKYHNARNTDPKQQGHYTYDGKLMIGYICQ